MFNQNMTALQSDNSEAVENNNLQIAINSEFGDIKYLIINSEPWFVGKDICDILGYTNTAQVYSRLDEDEKLTYKINMSGQKRDVTLVNESGLYSLIITSTKTEAKQFKKWVTSEVLPSIRKNGMYATESTIDKILADPDFGIELLQKLKESQKLAREEKLAREKVEQEKAQLIHTNKVYRTTELAKEIGLKSAQALNKLLEDNGIQYKVNGTYVFYRHKI